MDKKAKAAEKNKPQEQTRSILPIVKNKAAFFEYFVIETVEAGISLAGSEVKSIRQKKINIGDSFCFFSGGQLYLKNCQITPYDKGSFFNPDARRDRVLLLHKKEIDRLSAKVREKSLTLVPLSVYFRGRFVKVELGLCRGKKLHDKKDVIKARDIERDTKREVSRYI